MKLECLKKNVKKISAFFMLAVLISMSTPEPAQAYDFNDGYITNTITFIPSTAFGAESIAAFNNALYPWNYQSGRTLMLRAANQSHGSLIYPYNDGKSYIYKVYAGDEYVAYFQRFPTSGPVGSADININPAYPWANSQQVDCFDVWSVFAHESGHAAGLAHSSYVDATMYKFASRNSIEWRTLHEDDIEGIQDLYLY